MPIPYKIELFDRNFAFRSFSPLPQQDIEYDYLTMTRISLDVPPIAAEKGDYAIISSGAEQIFCGVVDDVAANNRTTSLSLKPIQALFEAGIAARTIASGSVEASLADALRDNFINSGDSLQNIPGLSIMTTTSTSGSLLGDQPLVFISDLIRTALSVYSVVMWVDLYPQEKEVRVTIGRVADHVTIEADLPAILEREIVLGDSYGQLNKLIVLDEADVSRRAVYYLHTDGSISSEDRLRVTPVFVDTILVRAADAAEFAEQAYTQAYNALSPQQYDNMIELTAPINSKVFPAFLPIGARADVKHNGKTYKSILTGFIRGALNMTLVFGVVRVDLTKKLTLQSSKK